MRAPLIGKLGIVRGTRWMLMSGFFALPVLPRAAHSATFYLDCSATSSGDGSSPALAWRTTSEANAHTFVPGDSFLLRRGSACQGSLQPKGSGSAEAPIHLGGYATGA